MKDWEIYLQLAIVVAKVDSDIFNKYLSKHPRNILLPADDNSHYAVIDYGMYSINGQKFTSFNTEPNKKCREFLMDSPFRKVKID